MMSRNPTMDSRFILMEERIIVPRNLVECEDVLYPEVRKDCKEYFHRKSIEVHGGG
jgi:hypothetical protein